MQKVILLTIGLVLTAFFLSSKLQEDPLKDQFHAYMADFEKSYKTEEEMNFRYKVYLENMEVAKELEKANPLASFGHTPFTDRTDEEMKKMMGDLSSVSTSDLPTAPLTGVSRPPDKDKDWSFYFFDVRTQGECGACWAFATIATTEAYRWIYGLGTNHLSVQQLIDCVDTNHGCEGGTPIKAYEYMNGEELCYDGDYRYKEKTKTCISKHCRGPPGFKGAIKVPQSEEEMWYQLQHGPLTVSLDATVWKLYEGGILKTMCGSDPNHSAVVSGFFLNDGEPYWLVRNSWGTNWGMDGQIKIAYGTNLCGINSNVVIPNYHL